MKEKINQTAGRLKQTVRAVGVGIATLTASFFMSAPAYAAGVQDSQIVKGTEKLVGDVTTWLMVLAPVVAGLLIIYFCIRRGMADEMDQKKWNNRIVVAYCCVSLRYFATPSQNRMRMVAIWARVALPAGFRFPSMPSTMPSATAQAMAGWA